MAEIKVPYEYDGRKFEGMLIYDDGVSAKRPAVFMQPDWLGVCRHSADMARQVAGSDYVVMMADMYGVGYGETEKPRPNSCKARKGCVAISRSSWGAAPRRSRR